MDAPLLIEDFILNLEKGLGTVFARQYLDGAIVLYAETRHFALIIYLAQNSKRIHFSAIKTFHIDQDQILRDSHKVIPRLFSLLGKGHIIYARQTVAARIEKHISLAFLDENHLQIAIPGKYRYGLYHQGELVSIAIFGGGRRMHEQKQSYRSFELLRFCHKAGYRVVGGLSKLIKSFVVDFHPADIMTYVDRDWSQDSNLRTLGFQEKGQTAPQAFWIVGTGRHYVRNAEHLDKLKQAHPTGYLVHNNGSIKLVLKL